MYAMHCYIPYFDSQIYSFFKITYDGSFRDVTNITHLFLYAPRKKKPGYISNDVFLAQNIKRSAEKIHRVTYFFLQQHACLI